MELTVLVEQAAETLDLVVQKVLEEAVMLVLAAALVEAEAVLMVSIFKILFQDHTLSLPEAAAVVGVVV
tara:strand:+ start:170 stop:376 length:207 start_codon:yes stop_codon:yes gene_type:complete